MTTFQDQLYYLSAILHQSLEAMCGVRLCSWETGKQNPVLEQHHLLVQGCKLGLNILLPFKQTAIHFKPQIIIDAINEVLVMFSLIIPVCNYTFH